MRSLGETEMLCDALNLDEKERRRYQPPLTGNQKMAAAQLRLLRQRVKRESGDSEDLPVFRRPRALPDGGLGNFQALFGKRTVLHFGIPLSGDEGHVGVLGESGSGKSTLVLEQIAVPAMERGLGVWILDTEDEYKPLIRIYDVSRLPVLDGRRFMFNLFQPVGDPLAWIGRVGDLFRQVFYCRDGSVNLLMQLLTTEYAERGIFEGSKDFPTIADIYRKVKGLRRGRGSRPQQYAETLENRLATLTQQLRPGILAKRSLDIEALMQGSVLLRLHGLSGAILNFFVSLIHTLFLVCRTGQVFNRPVNVLIAEEAFRLLLADSGRYDLGENVILSAPRVFRKRGILLVYTLQTAANVPEPVFANLSTVFTFRLGTGSGIHRVGNSMSLSPEQRDAISELRPRGSRSHEVLRSSLSCQGA